MLAPMALSITPDTMTSSHYQRLFAMPEFLHRFEYSTTCVANTLALVRGHSPQDYASLLRLTSWLFFVEHLLRTDSDRFVVENKDECKAYVRTIVHAMQRILHKHGAYRIHRFANNCDVSYPFRHEMFIVQLLDDKPSRPLSTTSWRQPRGCHDRVSKEGAHVGWKHARSNKQLKVCRCSRIRTRSHRSARARPNAIRLKI
jgi:hypothetical protein